MSNLPENNDVRAWLESQMNEKRPTLLAFADHGESGEVMTDDTASADHLIGQFEGISIDYLQLAVQLQNEGAESFKKSWDNLIKSISTKRNQL